MKKFLIGAAVAAIFALPIQSFAAGKYKFHVRLAMMCHQDVFKGKDNLSGDEMAQQLLDIYHKSKGEECFPVGQEDGFSIIEPSSDSKLYSVSWNCELTEDEAHNNPINVQDDPSKTMSTLKKFCGSSSGYGSEAIF